MNAYEILSNIKVYTKVINDRTSFLNEYFKKLYYYEDSYFKISDTPFLDSINFNKEVPVKNISFNLKRGSDIISITKLKEPKIIFNNEKNSIEIKIDSPSKVQLRDILEELSPNERLTINIKINERIEEFPIFCFFINKNSSFTITTDPYFISIDNPYLYLNYFTVDIFDFDLKNYFSFLSNCFKEMSLINNKISYNILKEKNYLKNYEIEINKISPPMFMLNTEKINKISNILFEKKSDIFFNIIIYRENNYFSKPGSFDIYLSVKDNIKCIYSNILINNLIGKCDTEEYLIKNFNLAPNKKDKEILNRDNIKIKDFLKVESNDEYVTVNLKLKNDAIFHYFKQKKNKSLKVSVEKLITESEKKIFTTICSNILFEEDWILISFNIKKEDQNEIYNIFKSFNGVLSIEIKIKEKVQPINYYLYLDYNSYNILFTNIIEQKYISKSYYQ